MFNITMQTHTHTIPYYSCMRWYGVSLITSYQLQMCDVMLPPQVGLEGGTQCTERIVSVHDHMY